MKKVALMPRLLRRERAADYLDVSPRYFDGLVQKGVVPAPKVVHEGVKTVKAWDRNDLDSVVDQMPYEGAAPPDNTWDD